MDSTGAEIAHLIQCLTIKQEDSHRFIYDLPGHLARAAGILKYRRESEDYKLTIVTQSQVLTDYQITCEYCGQKVLPSLNLIYDSETDEFCCDQRQQLCELLKKIQNLLGGKSEDSTEDRDAANRDLVYQRRMEKLGKLYMDTPKENNSDLNKDYIIEVPVQEAGAGAGAGSKTLNFQLSCQPEEYLAKFSKNQGAKRADFLDITLKKEVEEPFSVPLCNHTPLEFGLCYHHQDGGDFVRYYCNGLTFISVFKDGSVQVFYPSGLLAVIVVVTKEHGRVCIVYDNVPDLHIRALFQSDGKGCCYHGNGNIWMTIDKSGGQCLDPEGTRVRRWTWDMRNTSFRPIFLPINKSIGLRVLGKEQVFVSFLARGQQAKFNVGAWCHKDNCEVTNDIKSTSRPTLVKEEIIVLAYRIKMHRLIQHLHWCMTTPSHPNLPSATLPPHLHHLAQKLLKAGKEVKMSDDENDFPHSCL